VNQRLNDENEQLIARIAQMKRVSTMENQIIAKYREQNTLYRDDERETSARLNELGASSRATERKSSAEIERLEVQLRHLEGVQVQNSRFRDNEQKLLARIVELEARVSTLEACFDALVAQVMPKPGAVN